MSVESLLSHVMGRPVRVVLSPEPDLLAESGERAVRAARAAADALGSSTAVAGIWFELPATKGLPDPYGPDPVVFGSVPRVREP